MKLPKSPRVLASACETIGGPVKPEQVDRLLSLADESAKRVGVITVDEALAKVRQFTIPILETLRRAETRDQLARELREFEVPEDLEELLLQVVRFMPELLRHWARELNERATKTLPAPQVGRSTVPAEIQLQMIRFIEHLYIEKKVALKEAKLRARNRFRWSIRTVNRYWSRRKEILESGPTMRFADVLAGLKAKWEADRKLGEAPF
jgi:hypothetical protein